MITEVVIPLGKPAATGWSVTASAMLDQLTLAIAEAQEAGATRFTLAYPRGWDATPALEAAKTLTGLDLVVLPEPGAPASVVADFDPAPGIVAFEGETAVWDHMVAAAIRSCQRRMVFLIDPMMGMVQDAQPVTSGLLQLTKAPRRRLQPVLGTARLPWEHALQLPVLQQGGKRQGLNLSFDRALDGEDAELTVFCGRAILDKDLMVEAAEPSIWPHNYRFPFETLVQTVTPPGSRTFAHPLEGNLLVEGAALPANPGRPLLLWPETTVA